MKAPAAAVAALAVVALGVGKGAAADQTAAAGVSLQPGQWEMAAQMTSVEIPGASPEAQAEVRRQIGQPQTSRECITPEQSRNPLAQMREMLAQGEGANCRFTDQVHGNGVIRIRGTCPGPGGRGSAQVAMEGSFTATTMQMTLTINAQGTNPATPGTSGMRMSVALSGHRVGECPAAPPPPATGEPPPETPPPPPPPPSRS
ncbi:MAG: hypothetical protein QOD42_3008 [Sphingomonadales bacterium]|nr:hypothetical protein [Sphingomonadales bacterium]